MLLLKFFGNRVDQETVEQVPVLIKMVAEIRIMVENQRILQKRIIDPLPVGRAPFRKPSLYIGLPCPFRKPKCVVVVIAGEQLVGAGSGYGDLVAARRIASDRKLCK